jgi:hypothetical protein
VLDGAGFVSREDSGSFDERLQRKRHYGPLLVQAGLLDERSTPVPGASLFRDLEHEQVLLGGRVVTIWNACLLISTALAATIAIGLASHSTSLVPSTVGQSLLCGLAVILAGLMALAIRLPDTRRLPNGASRGVLVILGAVVGLIGCARSVPIGRPWCIALASIPMLVYVAFAGLDHRQLSELPVRLLGVFSSIQTRMRGVLRRIVGPDSAELLDL